MISRRFLNTFLNFSHPLNLHKMIQFQDGSRDLKILKNWCPRGCQEHPRRRQEEPCWPILPLFFAMFGRFGAHMGLLVASWARSFNKMTEMQKQPPLTQFWKFIYSLKGLLGGYLGSSWGFIASYWLHLAPTWCHFEQHPKLSLDPWARFDIKIKKCKNKHPSHSFGGLLQLSVQNLSPSWAPLTFLFS